MWTLKRSNSERRWLARVSSRQRGVQPLTCASLLSRGRSRSAGASQGGDRSAPATYRRTLHQARLAFLRINESPEGRGEGRPGFRPEERGSPMRDAFIAPKGRAAGEARASPGGRRADRGGKGVE